MAGIIRRGRGPPTLAAVRVAASRRRVTLRPRGRGPSPSLGPAGSHSPLPRRRGRHLPVTRLIDPQASHSGSAASPRPESPAGLPSLRVISPRPDSLPMARRPSHSPRPEFQKSLNRDGGLNGVTLRAPVSDSAARHCHLPWLKPESLAAARRHSAAGMKIIVSPLFQNYPLFGSIFSWPFFCPQVGEESVSERANPTPLFKVRFRILLLPVETLPNPVFHAISTPIFPYHSYPRANFPYQSYPSRGRVSVTSSSNAFPPSVTSPKGALPSSGIRVISGSTESTIQTLQLSDFEPFQNKSIGCNGPSEICG